MSGDTEAAEAEIAALLLPFYEAVSGPRGVGFRAGLDAGIHHPRARLARTEYTGGTPALNIFTLAEHRADAEEVIRAIDFYEVETSHDIFVYGNIAHVVSRYDAYGDADGKVLLKRGVNLIQLARTADGWRVYSVIWDDETNEMAEKFEAARAARADRQG
jgi:hypothetical protein